MSPPTLSLWSSTLYLRGWSKEMFVTMASNALYIKGDMKSQIHWNITSLNWRLMQPWDHKSVTQLMLKQSCKPSQYCQSHITRLWIRTMLWNRDDTLHNHSNVRGDFCMIRSLAFSLLNPRYIPKIPPKCSVMSWTWANHFSSATGSCVTNLTSRGRLSPPPLHWSIKVYNRM